MGKSQAEEIGSLRQDIERVLVDRAEIARRVGQLSAEIVRCYEGQDLTILAVLTGSLMFLADLMRHIPLRVRLHVLSASSYVGTRTTPTELRLEMPPMEDIAGRHVLLVDDILDTGQTIKAISSEVGAKSPASLRTCVLLRKEVAGEDTRPAADFCGFDIDPEFVVGYGLDYGNLYRNLPDICILKREVIEGNTRPEGRQT